MLPSEVDPLSLSSVVSSKVIGSLRVGWRRGDLNPCFVSSEGRCVSLYRSAWGCCKCKFLKL